MLKYRGKYPNKIRCVTSSSGVTIVTTNNGKLFSVSPLTPSGRRRMPRLGDFIHEMALTGDYAIEERKPRAQFRVVEKRNHLAVHGQFSSREAAERHLREVIPVYVARSYFMDKTLRAEDFEIE